MNSAPAHANNSGVFATRFGLGTGVVQCEPAIVALKHVRVVTRAGLKPRRYAL
jgi:hypothetical protein